MYIDVYYSLVQSKCQGIFAARGARVKGDATKLREHRLGSFMPIISTVQWIYTQYRARINNYYSSPLPAYQKRSPAGGRIAIPSNAREKRVATEREKKVFFPFSIEARSAKVPTRIPLKIMDDTCGQFPTFVSLLLCTNEQKKLSDLNFSRVLRARQKSHFGVHKCHVVVRVGGTEEKIFYINSATRSFLQSELFVIISTN